MMHSHIMSLRYHLPIGHSVDVYDALDTTNGYLMSIATKSTPTHGTAIVAHHQTAGRGQIGRSWHDEAGANLLISYLLRPTILPLDKQYLLNLVVSIAVQRMLKDLGIEAKIKWPNDIYVGDKKVAGLLVQCSLQGSNIQHAVIGIGLNVNQANWPSDVPNPTSTYLETNRKYNSIELIPRLSQHLSNLYPLMQGGHYRELRKVYHQHLYLCNTWTDYTIKAGEFRGQLIEVDQEGRAVIEWEGGEVRRYRHGEVSLSKGPN